MIIKKAIVAVTIVCVLIFSVNAQGGKRAHTIQFIFTSDVHFGLTKENFRNKKNVPAVLVNAAMIRQMNRLPGMQLPDDGGVNAGVEIKSFEALIITGDIANREEPGIQNATASWREFIKDYTRLVHLKTIPNKKTRLLIMPGNHDVSNAIGYRKPMIPLKDPTSLIGIYNLMMHPVVKKNKTNFNYRTDKVHYSVNIGNIHFMFINLWPDSAERAWMEKDLAKIKNSTPVFLFTHSMPDVEARFFVNPNGFHDINDTDKFENLVSENFKDGQAVTDSAIKEQQALAVFFQLHPNIKFYFHGHSNYTEFYDWKSPNNNILLHCFRADSPMKGKYSAKDETKLSFWVISIDYIRKKLTARECLWNTDPSGAENLPQWGISVSIPF